MVAPAVGAALISGATSILGGLFGASGAKKAAQIQQQTSREQIAASNANRDYQYSLNAPTIDAGNRATELFAGFNGAGSPDYGAYVASNPDLLAEWNRVQGEGRFQNMADYGRFHFQTYGQGEGRAAGATDGGSAAALEAFRGSTGYRDLLDEGLGAVKAGAFAGGMGRSGATLKALQDRGMSIADRSSSSWLANLNSLMNFGGQARGLVANVGTNTVTANNNASQNAADAASNASLVNSSNWANTLKNLGLAASNAYGSSYGGGSSGGYTAPGMISGYGGGTFDIGGGVVTPQFGYRNVT